MAQEIKTVERPCRLIKLDRVLFDPSQVVFVCWTDNGGLSVGVGVHTLTFTPAEADRVWKFLGGYGEDADVPKGEPERWRSE